MAVPKVAATSKPDTAGQADKPDSDIAELNLYQKLSAITGEIGSIAKGGTNNEQKYSFIEYAAVAGALRTLFSKYHVMVIPNMGKREAVEFTSSYGKRGVNVTIEFVFTFVNSDKPDDRMEIHWVGEAADYGDKGTNKAATAALKYCLMRTFNVSEKGDEDPDAASPDRGAAAAQAAQQRAVPAKPKTITMQDAMARLAARMTTRGFADAADRKRLLLRIAGVQTANDLRPADLDHVSEVVETATTDTLRGYLDIETATTDTPATLPDLAPRDTTPAVQPATLTQMTRIGFYMRAKHVADEDIAEELAETFGVQNGTRLTFDEAASIIEHFSALAKKAEEAKQITDGADKAFPNEAAEQRADDAGTTGEENIDHE
jgi:hypothetical protein